MNLYALLQTLFALVSSLFKRKEDSKELDDFKKATNKAKNEKDPTDLDASF